MPRGLNLILYSDVSTHLTISTELAIFYFWLDINVSDENLFNTNTVLNVIYSAWSIKRKALHYTDHETSKYFCFDSFGINMVSFKSVNYLSNRPSYELLDGCPILVGSKFRTNGLDRTGPDQLRTVRPGILWRRSYTIVHYYLQWSQKLQKSASNVSFY